MARDRAARPEARPLRLFLAVELPGSVKEDLARAIAPFRETVPGARWTDPAGWHVTLKFLGSTWPRLVGEVGRAAGEVAAAAAPFRTELAGIGAFPGPRRARVLWAGLADPDERLGALARGLDVVLLPHFRAESRPFAPHLTVARLNPPANVAATAPALLTAALESGPFPVDRLVLYRSHLSPRGARYEPLGEFALGAASRGA